MTPTITPSPSPVPTGTPQSEVEAARSEFLTSLPGFSDISHDANVWITNAILAFVLLIIILLASEIFNQTLSENKDDIEEWLQHFFGPLIMVGAMFGFVMGVASVHSQKLRDMFWLFIVLLLSVAIQGFLDPHFGFNHHSVLLFFSLLIGVGFMTYLTEGVEAFIGRSFYGQATAVRVFPLAIFIALICVLFTRLTGFVPGVLYGFVGTAVFLRPPHDLRPEDEGRIVFVPMLLLFILSIVCWLFIDTVRGWHQTDLVVLLEGIMVGVFVGGLQGVLINMLPMAFMDGKKLMQWNFWVWLVMAGLATFFFWLILLNDQRAYYSSLTQTTVQVALLLGLSCLAISMGTWAFFRYRKVGPG